MSKIDDIKNLKSLLDEKVIDLQEFHKLKNEILGTDDSVQVESDDDKHIKDDIPSESDTKKGMFTIAYAGRWFLIDAKTKISINGVYHSKHSTKKGFSIDIPLQSESIIIKVTLGGVKNRAFELTELNLNCNYRFELIYDTKWGQYSDKFKLTENGKSIS